MIPVTVNDNEIEFNLNTRIVKGELCDAADDDNEEEEWVIDDMYFPCQPVLNAETAIELIELYLSSQNLPLEYQITWNG